jgi:hypothetical protein
MAPGRPSPAQIHLGRNVRDELTWKVEQTQIQWEDVRKWRQDKNDRAKEYFDRGTKALVDLTKDQNVFVRVGDDWKEGKVVEKLDRPRSYLLQMKDGGRLERNRVKLKPDVTNHSKRPTKTLTYPNTCGPQIPRPEAEPQPVHWMQTATSADDLRRSPAEPHRESDPPAVERDRGDDEPAQDRQPGTVSGNDESQRHGETDTGMDNDQREHETEGSSDATENNAHQRRVIKKRRRLIEEI